MYNPDMKWLAVLVGIGLSWLGGNGVDVSYIEPKQSEGVEKKTVVFEDEKYEYLWYELSADETVSLSINVPKSKSSREFIGDNECRALINGGFYATNMRPLGLVREMDMIHSPEIKSSLFNGFLGWDDDKSVITQDSTISTDIMLQTGPLLLLDGKRLPLTVKNDEARRRMVAMIDSQGRLIFVGVREDESSQMGPFLNRLPEVLEAIADAENVQIESAINLDGGSASVFYDGESFWSEVKPVGTYLCVR